MTSVSPWSICSRCGAPRQGQERFCPRCGLDYWSIGPTGEMAPAATPVVTKPNDTIGLLAGLAWIGSALGIGYLAFLQLQYAGTGFADADDVMLLAGWNGVSAAITLFFGAKLILGVDRRFLVSSIGWAVLTVGFGVYQISQGFTHEAFLFATLMAGTAGILSFVDWAQRPRTQPAAAASSKAPLPGWLAALRSIAILVIGTIVILAVIGGWGIGR